MTLNSPSWGLATFTFISINTPEMLPSHWEPPHLISINIRALSVNVQAMQSNEWS